MGCENRDSLLQGYFDGELDLIRSVEFEKHLERCRVCFSQLEEQTALRQALRRANLWHHAPERLRARIAATLPRQTRREAKIRPGFPQMRWLAAATVILLGMFLTGIIVRKVDSQNQNLIAGNSLAREIVSSHIRSLQPGHLFDVESTDQHTVKPWFDGKLDFAPTVVDPAVLGFPLIGGRLDYLNGRTVAALVYRRQKHLINVFVWPHKSEPPDLPREQSQQGYNLLCWNRDGMDFCVISDLNVPELHQFAQTLQKQNSQTKI